VLVILRRLWHHGLFGVTIFDMRKNLLTYEKKRYEAKKGLWKNVDPRSFLVGLARQANTDQKELTTRYFLEPFDQEIVEPELSDDPDGTDIQENEIESLTGVGTDAELSLLREKAEQNRVLRETAQAERVKVRKLQKVNHALRREKRRLKESLQNQLQKRQRTMCDDVDDDLLHQEDDIFY
jgi:hypothetical protein